MPPKKPKFDCDIEPYFQFHNRIASFLEWNLDWEVSEDKPTPERLADMENICAEVSLLS
jgi:hypothetical protein